jgi:hypothetical protein
MECVYKEGDISMLKCIRTITIISSLMLPLAAYGSSEGDGAKADQKLTVKIQKAIAKDDSLSADAGAVSVTVENGLVTLKGAVRSDERRADIQAKAESEVIQVTPLDRIHSVVVRNQLTVSSN